MNTITTHGHTRGPKRGKRKASLTYNSWANMKQRCTNPRNKDHAHYHVHWYAPWSSFDQFFADMGTRPSRAHTIDRIDKALGYSPGNCRWATRAEQTRNSAMAKLTIEAVQAIRASTEPVKVLAKRYSITATYARQLKRGMHWSPDI